MFWTKSIKKMRFRWNKKIAGFRNLKKFYTSTECLSRKKKKKNKESQSEILLRISPDKNLLPHTRMKPNLKKFIMLRTKILKWNLKLMNSHKKMKSNKHKLTNFKANFKIFKIISALKITHLYMKSNKNSKTELTTFNKNMKMKSIYLPPTLNSMKNLNPSSLTLSN
jgi:hypothetical protein